MKFVGRKKELNILEREYRQDEARFVVIYGRRRIGKTRLVEEFLKEKKGQIYYLAADEKDYLQIKEMKILLGKFFGDEFLINNKFDDWKNLFSYLERIWTKDKRIIFIIDEVTYLIKNNTSFPSYFQQFWDKFLSKTNSIAILSGSIVNLMLKNVLGGESPLYGRRTSDILLQELELNYIMEFLNVSIEEAILFYSVLGGIPKYLELVDRPFKDFVFSMLDKNSFFYREGIYLMTEELKEIATYSNILRVISEGKTKIGEIASSSNMETKTVSAYLDILDNLGFIRKEVPVSVEEDKFRGAYYMINDNFLEFWFSFIHKNRSLIELDKKEELREILTKGINSFVGDKFEQVCKKVLPFLNIFNYGKIGRQWGKFKGEKGKNTYEIDIVALNEKTKEILFGECKWKEKVNANSILVELSEKAGYVDWHNKDRKESYAVFAKSFSKRIKEFEGRKVYCFDLRDIEKELKRH